LKVASMAFMIGRDGGATMIARWTLGLAMVMAFAAHRSSAATLPPHGPLRILVVSDAVNPHGLTDEQLTQPGDISAALTAPGSGLNLDPSADAVREIPTDSLPAATAALSTPIDDPAAYDVLVYFAHRIPNGPSGTQDQANFVAAVNGFLVAGGGMISFHHGSYSTSGKAAILDLVGGTASGAVPWNTVDGQDVINVAPEHFITTNGVEYPSSVVYSDVARGVALDTYPFFNNTPDERYPSFQINPTAGDIAMLFASNYLEGGSTHVLGFTHRRPGWVGVVVAYQPGEYQPQALDDLDGNNFQVLANALVYAANGGIVTAADQPPRRGPALVLNRPNPFNAITTIDFTLSESGVVDIALFDVNGARLRTLVSGHRPAGRHQTHWDGRRDDGTALSSGIYFCRVSSGASSRMRRMVLVN
jgi:hypothetical protein